jgi:hypothetical protein
MLNANKSSASPTPRQRSPGLPDHLNAPDDSRRTDGRISLDIPREHIDRSSPSVADYSGSGTVTPRSRMPWGNSKPRPTSMVSFSPPRSPSRSQARSPPKVTVQSPKSSPNDNPILSPRPSRPSSHAALASPSLSTPAAVGTKPFKIAALTVTPSQGSKPLSSSSPGQPSQLRQYLRLSTELGNRRYRASHTPPMSQRENRWPQRPPQTTLRTDPPLVLHLVAPAARKHPTLLRRTFRICPSQKSLQTRRAISRLPPYITRSPRSCLLQIRESRETKHPGDRLHHP